jgi:hypothetical protein
MLHTSPCKEEERQVEPEKKSPRERAEDLLRLLVPDWRPTARQGLWAVRIVLASVVVLGILTLVGQPFGITLWDWLKLLVVPAVIAGGGLWFNQQQRERELEIAERRSQDEALQAYLDQMSDMLIPKTGQPSLYTARPGDGLSSVARARTLAVLPRLDEDRKGRVVHFLYESGLIIEDRVIVDLRGANISDAEGWTEKQLSEVYSLEEATMPNHQKYEEWIKRREEDG